jgi:CrcB protein
VAEQPTRLAGGDRPADIDSDLTAAGRGEDAAGGGSPFDTARRSRPAVPWSVLGVVCAGGVAGALARYGIGAAFPHRPDAFPWATFGINVSGCLLIGVLMVLVADVWPTRRLLRPFLGTGLLGGYTTFSTYVVDIQHLLAAGAAGTALAYLAGTVLTALAAVYTGTIAARMTVNRLRHHRGTR